MMTPARNAYDMGRAPADREFDEAVFVTRKAYDEAVAPLKKVWDEAVVRARTRDAALTRERTLSLSKRRIAP